MKTALEALPLLAPGKTVCVFDTETTGLPGKGKVVKIIQFSAIRAKVLPGYKLEEMDFMDIYLNPEEPLSPKITEITGITDGMLAGAPAEQEIAPAIFRYMAGADTWAAYNARFDIGMLSGMDERTSGWMPSKPVVDVLEFSRDWLVKGVDVENHKLATAYAALYPEGNIRFHRAIEDVRATVKVMEALLPRYADEMAREEIPPSREVSLEKAYAWINPRRPSQQRICLRLTDGNETSSGDVFYDAVEKCWSHKSTTKAKRLFESLDMADIEQRVLRMCSNYYQSFATMDELAKNRISWLRKKRAGEAKERA